MPSHGLSAVPSSHRHSWISDSTAENVLSFVQVAYPIVLLLLYVTTFTIDSIANSSSADSGQNTHVEQLGPGGKPLPSKKRRPEPQQIRDLDFTRPRKLLFQWLQVGVLLSLGGNIFFVLFRALWERDDGWWCGQAPTVYLVGSFMIYTLLLITLVESVPSPNVAHHAAWIGALLMEIIIVGATFALYTSPHREHKNKLEKGMNEWDIIEVTIDIARVIVVLGLVILYSLFAYLRKSHQSRPDTGSSEEHSSLLGGHRGENGSATGPSHGYGATNGKPPAPHEAPAGWEKPKETPSRSWWEYFRAYAIFLPYIWPAKDRMLQINFVLCILIVLIQRGIQILVPIQTGIITDILAGVYPGIQPWGAIVVYVLYRIFQGSNGLLGAARQVLWIPIEQYSYRELSVAAFEHVHSLSLDFHLGKKTGEVLSALGKGASLNTFLESVTFNVLPMLIDLGAAFVYFLAYYDAYYALVIAIVTFWYIYITIRMAAWRADIRRQATNASREEDAVKNDSMVSYETVKYFNAEPYEFNRYREAVKKYQKAEYRVTFSLALMNTIQNVVFMAGLIVVCFIGAYQVSTGQRPVGSFVTLLSFMTQLQQPLNFFGTFYRMIQNNMINSERMLELFKEQPTVVDGPEAKELPSCEGEVRFNDVRFSYDQRKPALHGLSFRCKPGTTTALVGESGGGKSTVFRLLFRFYDAESGNIQLDAHDAGSVTIDSLRSHIGVVPQDTVLFNESLMYNLKYARQEATDEEVFAACRAASIHDKIMGFPDQYETKVGERGLRLSGGEKQRVAIARTIIKDPRIILLDEATAALDTETEEHIQEALQTLAQGRTMLVIAHRLSTITMCDQILVLHEGRVAERGTHLELLTMKGRYAGMWKKQVRAQRAAEEAKVLKDKADRLRRESMDSSAARHRALGGDDRPSSSDEEDHHHHHHDRAHMREQPTDLQSALSLSPRTTIPHAQISSILNGGDTGTDNLPVKEALRSGVIRSPSPVQEEDHSHQPPEDSVHKPPGHP